MSPALTKDAPADAGFGMVEMLVALAIASVVALGIGGLIALGAELRERTGSAEAIEVRLVELNALSATLERLAASNVSRADSGAVYLKKESAAQGPELMLRLEQGHLVASVTAETGNQQQEPEAARIDLAAFDGARLEYLVPYGDGHHQWTSRDPDAGVLAARMIVKKRHRSWPVVLWTRPSGGSYR